MRPIDYRDRGMTSAAIAKDLQAHYERWTGWETGERLGASVREGAGEEPEEPEGAANAEGACVCVLGRGARRSA